MTRTETELRLTDRLSRLADYARTEPTGSVDDHSLAELTLPPRPHRSRIPATVAAGVIAVAIVGSVVVVAEDAGDGTRTGITVTGPSSESFDQGATPPDVRLAGWTRSDARSTIVPPVPKGTRLFSVLVDDAKVFDGARIKIGITALPMSYSAGPDATPVDINGTPAELGTVADAEGRKSVVVWSPAPGRQLYVEGTDSSPEQVLQVARGLHPSGDLSALTVTADAIPEGLTLARVAEVSTEPVTDTEFRFERDGAQLQVNLYAGGRDRFEDRLSDPAHTVTVRGGMQGALQTESDGKHFRLQFPNGRWAVEIGGGPFVSERAFLDAVDSLVVTPAG